MKWSQSPTLKQAINQLTVAEGGDRKSSIETGFRSSVEQWFPNPVKSTTTEIVNSKNLGSDEF